MPESWITKELPEAYDVLAPDGSEIRLLGTCPGGSVVHCTLPSGEVTTAVRHRTVSEIWYVLDGAGELWRLSEEGREEITTLAPRFAVTLPLGTSFQFRATGSTPLTILIATMPAWPGADEAIPVRGAWTPTAAG